MPDNDISSPYLYKVLSHDGLNKRVNKLVRKLREHKDKFDGIVFTGVSGALAGPLLAIKLKKKMLVVRKENSHSFYKVEGDFSTEKYIIVDDFIDKGNTVQRIIKDINAAYEHKNTTPKLVGYAFYSMEIYEDDERLKYVPETDFIVNVGYKV